MPVDEHVIKSYVVASNDGHCGDSLNGTYLVMGWPLGQRTHDVSDERWYVGNPSDQVQKHFLLADFAADVTPPKDARYTSFHNSTFELWLAPSDQEVVAYIKTGGHFERWPRAKFVVGCM